MRRSELKRTAWTRRLPHADTGNPVSRKRPAVAHMDCAVEAIKKIVKAGAKLVRIGDLPPTSFPKEDAVRSEPYRRAVAGLRCIHCGLLGYSQCAHANTGKGASIKACDLQSFPLCTVHPGPDGTLVQGCHERFDQGALFSKTDRRLLEPAWIADTQLKIFTMGLWPKKLPITEAMAIYKEARPC